MPRKPISFNYFQPRLVLARDYLADNIVVEGVEERNVNNYAADIWDMSGFLNFLLTNRNGFRTALLIGAEFADIEPDSYSYNQTYDIFGFQVSKNRDFNIPSKRRLGEIKEMIMLQDDEYIGEFDSILYDHRYNVLMVQSNLYGLSSKQLEQYFTELRLHWLEEIGTPEEEDPFYVVLNPIIDLEKLDHVLDANYYRKIKIRATDIMLDALNDENSLFGDMRRTLGRSCGFNIELQISVGRTDRTNSLDGDVIRETIEQFRHTENGRRPKMDLTLLQNETAEIETVNLIEPRLFDRVFVNVESRTTVGHEYLFQAMFEKYNLRRTMIARMLVPVE